MSNLDSILKIRDITLPTKSKSLCSDFVANKATAVAFPVVIYGCESWTMKKAEH